MNSGELGTARTVIAQWSVMNITKSGKGYSVTTSAGVQQFADIDAALAFVNAETARIQATAPKAATEPTNCAMHLEGTKLTIVLDLSQDHGKSSTGKTNVVGSTHGNRRFDLPGGKRVFVGVNAYSK